MADGEVDRQKATVEDNPPPTVDRGKATVDVPPLTVDRQKATVAADDDTVNRTKATVSSKYTLIFYIQEHPPPDYLLKHIPKDSQTHPWNRPIIFGRGDDVDVFLNDERVSRNHLELTGQHLPDTHVCFSIQNMSMTNSVLVNGQEIPRKQMHFLTSGEIITVGPAISFKLEISPGEDMENYVVEFVHPQNDVCSKQPVQEVESAQEKKVGHKQVTKQPSEHKEDDESDAKPTQDTQKPKDVD